MGKLTWMRTKTLRGQMVSYFHLILVLSIIATIFTWGLTMASFVFLKRDLQPANYYERQIPDLVAFVREKKEILNKENQTLLDKVILLKGIDYQVINKKGQIIYGSMSKQYIFSEAELIKHLNTVLNDDGKYIKYYPIFDETQSLIGAIGFRYQLSLIAANPQSSYLIIIGFGIAFFSPFFYFYLFSYLMGKRFSKKIEQPFNEIIEGAHKIENHDLDFSLTHISSTKELNQLVAAFEEMKEALKESLQKQWKLEQDRREMVAVVAHDLKTPLTIIQGHVEGLLEMKIYNPERLERYLHTIQSSCYRSIQLIRELNDVSKIEQPEFTLEIKQTDIRKMILNKIREYNQLCNAKNVSLKTTIDDTQTEIQQVWIDPFRINQVLDNILSNCLRYTPPLGKIEWKTTITKQKIIFEIMDNGQGFSPENTSRIFEKFFREDTSRNSEDGHSGLGLFIAKTIVKKHNGEITARNREEGGAYFKIIIENLKE